jgi:hypothetical protein
VIILKNLSLEGAGLQGILIQLVHVVIVFWAFQGPSKIEAALPFPLGN